MTNSRTFDDPLGTFALLLQNCARIGDFSMAFSFAQQQVAQQYTVAHDSPEAKAVRSSMHAEGLR